MAIKKINTDLQIEARLLDGDGNSGTSNQILISTGTGVDWVDGSGSSIIGGPYLPLTGGTMTGNIKGGNAVKLLLGAGDVFQLYNDGNGFLRNYTGNLYIDQNTDNGLITFRNDNGTGGIGNYFILDGNTTHAYFSNPGNVGIGTTSPTSKIHVIGQDATFYSNTGSQSMQIGRNVNERLELYVNDSIAKITAIQDSDNNGPHDFILNRIFAGTGSNNFIVQKDGSAQLTINTDGNATFAGSIYAAGTIGNITAGSLGQQMEKGNASVTTLRFDANRWRLYAGASAGEVFTVEETGNVGIGTTSPDSKLEVLGVADLGSSGYQIRTSQSVGNNSAIVHRKDSGGSLEFRAASDDYNQLFIQSGGNIGIGTSSPTFQLHVNSIDASDNVAYIHHNNPSQSSGDVLKVRSDAGDNAGSALLNVENNTGSALYVRGDRNVGIGTTSPSQKLHVAGNAYVTGQVQASNAVMKTHSGHAIFGSNSTSVPVALGRDAASLDLVVSTSGNVGIRTDSPRGKLQINGNGNSWNEAPSVRLWDTTNGKGWLVGNVNNYTAGDFYIRTFASVNVDPTSASQEFTIKHATGNVGIGTTSPGHKLQVNGGVYATNYLSVSGVNTNFNLYNNGTTYLNGDTTVDSTFLVTNGNVGIGTTSPDEKLDVAGKVQVTGASLTVLNASDPSVQVSDTDTNYKGAMRWLSSDNVLEFYTRYGGTYYTSNLVLDRGNVGIGTTSPGAKLDVVGPTLGNTSGDTAIAAQIQAGRQSIDFKNFRTANESDWNNATFKIQARIDSTVHQSINFVNDASYNEHIDIYTGNQVFNTRFNANGNVGIGTTSPGVNFQVGDGTTDTSSRFYHNDNTYTQVSGYGLYLSRLSSYIRPVFDGTQDLYFGNVGLVLGNRITQFDATNCTFENRLWDSEAMRVTN